MSSYRKAPEDRFQCTDGGRQEAGIQERNDCAVRAVAIALDLPYAEAHARFKALGRRDGKGTSLKITKRALGDNWLLVMLSGDLMTYARFSREVLPQLPPRVVVCVTEHMFAVINGVQHDSGNDLFKPRARVHGYYVPIQES